jgi:putative hydrolase of the HAD superfamily
LYDTGKIESDVIRKERFKQVLEVFNAYDQKLSEDISYNYLHTCPTKCKLIPKALETVEYLAGKYSLTIVTNGFEDIQHTKLKSMDLNQYFDHVITSQRAGAKKPSREIFDFALSTNGIAAPQAIMIGDNLRTDIAGARNAAIDSVFYNPESSQHAEVVKHEISTLEELCGFL